ncbi:DUF5133 domain-containing protein [Streptomyces sp. NBC_01454]|uniref:DUF5133 domain-containing protein n=2 Tax=unclassified Streptomyces TaxID=2593676 RepID=UPI003FCCAD24
MIDAGQPARETDLVMAYPPHLRELVERCETLRRRLAVDHSAETARRLEDAAHALCLLTGAPADWTRRCTSPVSRCSRR